MSTGIDNVNVLRMSEVTEQFKNLSRQAEEAWNAGMKDCYQLEPFLLNVLNFTKSLPEKRDELATCFCEIARDPYPGTWEIVQFCMRELQWPEVKQAVEEVYRKHRDPRMKRIMERILDVWGPAWDEAEFWDYYTKKGAKGERAW